MDVQMMALNYNSLATVDDNSCEYAEEGYDCDGACLNDAACNDRRRILLLQQLFRCTDVRCIRRRMERSCLHAYYC